MPLSSLIGLDMMTLREFSNGAERDVFELL